MIFKELMKRNSDLCFQLIFSVLICILFVKVLAKGYLNETRIPWGQGCFVLI